MKKSEELFTLIKSLKTGEKRHFKLYCSKYSTEGEKKYVQLFNEIDKQSEYSKEALLIKFKGEAFVRQFSVAKNYLYNLILRSLSDYYKQKDVSPKLNAVNYYNEAIILNLKGALIPAINRAKKALKIAKHIENYALILEVMEFQHSILKEPQITKEPDKARQRKELKQRTIKRLNHLACLQAIHLKTKELIDTKLKHQKYDRINLSHNMESLPHLDEIKQSDKLSLIHYCIQLNYYYLNDDYTLCIEEIERLKIEGLWQTPACQELSAAKLSFIKVLGYAAFATGNLEGINWILNLAVKTALINYREEVQLKALTSLLQLRKTNSLKESEKFAPDIGKLEALLDDHHGEISEDVLCHLFYELAHHSFLNKNFKAALQWLLKTTNDNRFKNYEDIQVTARIMILTVHFELQNFDLLGYLHRQTVGFIQKSSSLYEQEMIFLNYMRTIKKKDAEDPDKSFYKALKEKLKKQGGIHSTNLFDYVGWLKVKINEEQKAS